ncbi:unnamed protein product [Bursaphelenchus okinawaensis]|uniref:Uncharacterized protein n=1 Tax=Bursaphelenchus okinawaensis TaxID=465554 RepID=A0A811K4I9_9BILA|nr:unnamed protein product [Bursaphelenchus okinawaensis]CAG9092294.1 unnamed protein product [Bursaphelenchus okinawaensis]
MDSIYRCLLKFLWPNVVNHLTSMEDVCSFAMVNKHFYKIVAIDFKSLCYKNVIFRTYGETWAYAFQHSSNRTFGQIIEPINNRITNMILHNSVCCPYSGTMAIFVRHKYVFITNIDSSLSMYQLIDFTKWPAILHIQLIKKGAQLLITTSFFYIIYDLTLDTVVRAYYYELETQYGWYVVRESDGTLFDVYNQIELELDASVPHDNFKALLQPVDTFKERSYLQYYHQEKGHMVLNLKTRNEISLPVLGQCSEPMEANGFLIDANFNNVCIYNLDTGDCVFNKDMHRAILFSNEFFLSPYSKDYVFYDKKWKQWVATKCHYRVIPCTTYITLAPFLHATLGYTFESTESPGFYVHIEFKNDRLNTKTFKPVTQHDDQFQMLKYSSIDDIAWDYVKLLYRVKERENEDTVLTWAERMLRLK